MIGENDNRTYGRWEALKVCIKCEKPLGENDIYHGDGVCPKCGNISSATIVKYKRVIRRKVYTYKPTLFERIIKRRSVDWYWEYSGEDDVRFS